MSIEIGQTVGGYEVVRRLGAGGLGVVFEVRHLISRRSEAMKVLLPERTITPESAERFRREVQLLAALSHPNIAGLHNAFYHGDQLVMIMELITGETLRSRSMRSAIPLSTALRYGQQILSALKAAHSAGIVHRDIKPSNVMLTTGDQVKLLDFGVAVTEQLPELTGTGYLVGSLHYMSPEQVTGGKATARSDIYSVGVTLYELLTGRLPIGGSTNYEIMTAHLQQTPAPPSDLNPSLPPAISRALLRALAKSPEERFATAQEFGEALRLEPARPRPNLSEYLGPVMGLSLDKLAQNKPGDDPQEPAGRELDLSNAQTIPTTTLPRTSTGSASGASPSGSSGGIIQGVPLEEITRALAEHIGPVAKFVVRKLAAQCADVDQLYALAAREIPSETGRHRFLRSRRK